MAYEVKKEFWITLPDENADQEVAGYFAIHDKVPWQLHFNVGDQIDIELDGDFSEEDIAYLVKHQYITEVN